MDKLKNERSDPAEENGGGAPCFCGRCGWDRPAKAAPKKEPPIAKFIRRQQEQQRKQRRVTWRAVWIVARPPLIVTGGLLLSEYLGVVTGIALTTLSDPPPLYAKDLWVAAILAWLLTAFAGGFVVVQEVLNNDTVRKMMAHKLSIWLDGFCAAMIHVAALVVIGALLFHPLFCALAGVPQASAGTSVFTGFLGSLVLTYEIIEIISLIKHDWGDPPKTGRREPKPTTTTTMKGIFEF